MKLIFFTLLNLDIVDKTMRNCNRYTTSASDLRRPMTDTSSAITKRRTSEFQVVLTLMKSVFFGGCGVSSHEQAQSTKREHFFHSH